MEIEKKQTNSETNDSIVKRIMIHFIQMYVSGHHCIN